MTPTVSVALITYNHGDYIRRAVEGVLAQETPFPVELIVGDDCSTDATPKILAQLMDEYPGRISLRSRERNLGMQHNVIDVLAHCRGQYMALLDGDDYWTDNAKLAKQVSFLERHRDCAMCHHNVLKLYQDEGGRTEVFHRRCPRKTKLASLMRGNFIATCSTLYRWGLVELPDWFSRVPSPDWCLNVLHGLHGKIGYITDISAVYRIHSGGIWSTQSRRKDLARRLEAAGLLATVVPPRERSILQRTMWRWHDDYVEQLLIEGDDQAAHDYAVRECEDMRGYARLNHFYQALAHEAAGHRWDATADLVRAATSGVGRTRIGIGDILLALARIRLRPVYVLARGMTRILRKSQDTREEPFSR